MQLTPTKGHTGSVKDAGAKAEQSKRSNSQILQQKVELNGLKSQIAILGEFQFGHLDLVVAWMDGWTDEDRRRRVKNLVH